MIYNNQKDIRQEEKEALEAILAMGKEAKEKVKEKAETKRKIFGVQDLQSKDS